ncbi:MAG TPA: helix-turn-helix domain-containing protein [Solirubrobacteraceae bacterium]|nr:helix-turn-helix domain-containing protein [Solirubrobacteraceae bacterium]
MTKGKQVSITLSPSQIDEVVRAATHTTTPSVSGLILSVLSTERPTAKSNERKRVTKRGKKAPRDDLLADADPKLSRSLLRGLSILTCFSPAASSRGVLELAEQLGMSPSTTHRYVVTLVEVGLLERCPTTRRYQLPKPTK